ncbi:MAG: HAMP domain-containing histidine kinase, partial [Pseudopedobacter sp.]|nr:HAMP domain-containing histidine kinase [Deinococcales bacterium]
NSSGVVFWQWVESRQKIIFDGLASALFGLPPETRYMDASTFLNLILEEDRTTFERSIQQAFETLERHATDIRILRRGQIRWVQVRGKVALEDSIQVINGVFLDITERKLIELRLRELNEAQKRFVSDAAHELRAPLTSIQGNLELVRLYPQMPPDEQLGAIGDAEREAARLGRLVADLLTLARGDRGVEMMEDDLKLDEVLQEAWRSALPLGRNHWMELLTLEACRVLGDRDRLKQLTLILLENALKYTPPDGKITLELKCLEGHVEFRVSDNGVGIAETDLERVFERFYRTDEARVRGEDPGGTGLGLSIGKWIAELHGGKVWLERADAGGTVAVVRLPRLELEG